MRVGIGLRLRSCLLLASLASSAALVACGDSAPSDGVSAGSAPVPSGGSAVGGASGGSAQGGAAPPAGSGGTPGSVAGAPGTAGSAGVAGSGGATTNARHPFPVNRRSTRCTYPTTANAEAARAAYASWKSEIITADGARGHLRTRRPNSPGAVVNSTVSEGIAYGMMLAVAMDDQHVFDELWKYSQLFLNQNGLMHWYINPEGTAPIQVGGATDSDEDMAWALVLADRQWGGSGTQSATYLELARAQIDRVWRFEVDHTRGDLVLPGDSWGANVLFNPSYFAPNEYRVFGEVSGNVEGWNRVIDTGYALLEKCLSPANGNEENGLVPAWCDVDGNPKEPFPGGQTNYQYDSARTPFRIGLDYCYSGEPRALAYLQKVSRFFANIGATAIVDGYDLNGMPRPDPATPAGSPQSAVFVGSAAVGAMHDPSHQAFIDAAYQRVATGELLARSRYYNLSWTALTLFMLTGNLIEYSP